MCSSRNIIPFIAPVFHNNSSIEKSEFVADSFGVPFLSISADGISTCDGSHLNLQSSRLYTSRLAKALDEHIFKPNNI